MIALEWKGGVLAGSDLKIVYEPLGNLRYACRYWSRHSAKAGEAEVRRDIATAEERWEGEDKKRKLAGYALNIAGENYSLPAEGADFFTESLPFRVPSQEALEDWISGKRSAMSTQELWRRTELYASLVLALGEKFERKVMVLAVFQTWLRRILDWAFNIDLGGPFGSGKTSALEALGEICFHSILGNPSAATTARFNESYDLTWLIDEYDKIKNEDEGLIDTFIRQGYRRGVKIYRFNMEKGRTESFDPFGPKFLSYHGYLETALRQRSLSHVKMEISPDHRLPIINYARAALSHPLLDEFFLWYMENIADLVEGGMSVKESMASALEKEAKGGDVFSILLEGSEPDEIKIDGERAREKVYEIVTRDLSDAERALLKELKGRGAELGFLAITIARLLKIDIVEELREALRVKGEEEEEPEFNPTEIIKEVIGRLHYVEGKEEITQGEVLVNARALAKNYGQDMTPKMLGSILRDLGFRPGLNMKRKGKRGIRILRIDEKVRKNIPQPEGGTEEKAEILLRLTRELSAGPLGYAIIDSLEARVIEAGIKKDEFGPLIARMIKEGLLVATEDEKGVRASERRVDWMTFWDLWGDDLKERALGAFIHPREKYPRCERCEVRRDLALILELWSAFHPPPESMKRIGT